MRVIVVGLGVQGRKRLAVAGSDVVATVDPVIGGAHYKAIEEVPLASFDAALLCTPDQAKAPLLRYLLGHGKHVLVEKPLVAEADALREFQDMARASGVACYTAYNHRFEPHIVRLKQVVGSGVLGNVYVMRAFYGNGTALDVKRSPWRDQGVGVLADLGSHLLDIVLLIFGEPEGPFELWSANRFENHAFDHVLFGSRGRRVIALECSLIAWRNTFTLDVFGQRGSAHIQGLCKWGTSRFILRTRVIPSGKPTEEVQTLEGPDPTWALEYEHFTRLCESGGTNLSNDLWIACVLNELGQSVGNELLV